MATRLAPTPLAGSLYVVATPIGNLEDISLRALRILREVELIAAENIQHTRALLTHYGVATRLISYREHNRTAHMTTVLHHLEVASVALVSDAGMPAISDPGAELIAAVVERCGKIIVVPGPNAGVMALVASGLPPAPYIFMGFLSRQRSVRLQQLESVATRPETLVLYEAPHRLLETLKDLERVLGDRPAAACRELTKMHEEIRRETLSSLQLHFTASMPRGEFTLVIGGAGVREQDNTRVTDADIDAQLLAAMSAGDDMRCVIAMLAVTHLRTRRSLYARWQSLRTPVDRE